MSLVSALFLRHLAVVTLSLLLRAALSPPLLPFTNHHRLGVCDFGHESVQGIGRD
nr:MAG TPA: hypothetical protein [Caudoviricetes sp.]